jgi:hypothetical protein
MRYGRVMENRIPPLLDEYRTMTGPQTGAQLFDTHHLLFRGMRVGHDCRAAEGQFKASLKSPPRRRKKR